MTDDIYQLIVVVVALLLGLVLFDSTVYGEEEDE
jgi:hypothetical protein